MRKPLTLGLMAIVLGLGTSSGAQALTSTYTKIDIEQSCHQISKYELGATFKCKGYKGIPIYFSEGDLRQSVVYGFANPEKLPWQSFGEFNHISGTVEWRIHNNQPVAAIMRWFIENTNTDTGETGKEDRGQVLVVSKIIAHEGEKSCPVGYVDARANKNANILARKIADTLAADFDCTHDVAKFHGKRGKTSGSPVHYANEGE